MAKTEDSQAHPALDPARLPVPDAARLLGVKDEVLDSALEAGAPRNADGTLNLVHFAAWLNRALRGGEEPDAEA